MCTSQVAPSCATCCSNLVAKIDVTQKAFGDKLTGDFGVFGSSFKNNDIVFNIFKGKPFQYGLYKPRKHAQKHRAKG